MSRLERELENRKGDKAIIFLNYPSESTPGSPEFVCEVGIDGPDSSRKGRARGLGAMQALYLGMLRLSALIELENKGLSGDARWLWPGGKDDADFGLPKNHL